MSDAPPAAPEPPTVRKRTPWSFRSLVEDVSGRPITDFQESSPGGLPAPSARSAPRTSDVPLPVVAVDSVEVRPAVAEAELALDPVARIYPPLSGATARSLHGAGAEHHPETLRSVMGPEEQAGARARPPGPSRRPERIYLHYLLLHLDRLHDPALRYLKQAVDEEIAHRETALSPVPEPPAAALIAPSDAPPEGAPAPVVAPPPVLTPPAA